MVRLPKKCFTKTIYFRKICLSLKLKAPFLNLNKTLIRLINDWLLSIQCQWHTSKRLSNPRMQPKMQKNQRLVCLWRENTNHECQNFRNQSRMKHLAIIRGKKWQMFNQNNYNWKNNSSREIVRKRDSQRKFLICSKVNRANRVALI